MTSNKTRTIVTLRRHQHDELKKIKELKLTPVSKLIQEGIDMVIEKHYEAIKRSGERHDRLMAIR